jgi:putative flippase GtrA
MKQKLTLKEELWIAVKYGSVGVLNTLVFTGSVFLLSKTELHYMYFTAIAYIIAISLSFIMNMKFTFSKFPGKVVQRAVKFITVAIFLMLLAEILQYLLIERVGFSEFTGIVLGMISYTITGFLINRLWVFK